ncbi:F0F1 ATP synthase subunit A [uncultured Thomasclavelia sp.]|uniref:F0F1 ATP synthase subunit A n=1 Tax=uncultured Thomasclavelia sp. TaxID=3025759 RepID=UPI0025D69206|nr:FoF1 ATP synthase subunit a [uncultured Thomasclavelia sp.]
MIEIQVELIYSLIIMTALCIAFILIGNKFKKANPLEKPKGVVLVVETGINMIYNYMSSIMPGPPRFAKNYYPYFSMLFIYVFICNISGLWGFEAPTSCLSITLAMGLTTITLIQYNALRTNGLFAYVKNLLIPPTNILGAISPMISLSMRLFGNILAGSILMSLVYSFTGYLSSYIIDFNFLGPFVASILHMYFDVFAGFVQTLIFVTLSSILISIEVN